ncbi:TPA: hypothetical protein QHB43_004276 [Aeromonas hydrophila subsp. hydrophila]|nr:hypothetical protein [Aeromonas hydrophila subsp. hydrophila]
MNNEKCQEYVRTIHMHSVFGAAFLLPLMLTSCSFLLKQLDNPEALDYLTIFLPALVMISPLAALYITTFRHFRVKMAKYSLSLLSCGICFGALYVGNRFLGENASLIIATLVPYIYLRIIGKGILDRERELSEAEILYLNE